MEFVRSVPVPLKTHPFFTERWLQEQIINDVSILGLGISDLDVKDVERRQPGAGRLDLLLFDPDTTTRYEVEIQLGPTDESHIIRTLEYWDNERRRFPQYDHVAVIVAEEITGRFLNVISLFNQAIPLIAIQMTALDVAGTFTLHATKVLDIALPAPEEDDDSGHETDRSYWENRANPAILGLTDRLLQMVNDEGADVTLKYNKHYIGLQQGGLANNFITFRPRKKNVTLEARIDRTDTLDSAIENWGLSALTYDKRWRRYRVSLDSTDLASNEAAIRALIKMARGIPVDDALDAAAS
ncbi:hypothetical protein [Rhodococcus sp. IEGM 1408]|uniref:hypothetical protein n=1 Tax=Rhodococcus sp. IEGM 1408 TaxID=3082220 RepID=UPI002954F743|nr:hypothetical protein [Rhodococcus sp. IEGM 1408]MDV8002875.1 hypothetical protein [Rhodococcus sp. IEGM 1408]